MNAATTDSGRRLVLLLGGLALAGGPCWRCTGQLWTGAFFVGEQLDGDGHAGPLCAQCLGWQAPALAAAVQGLNLLDASLSGLSPRHAALIAEALVDMAEVLNVEPTERPE